MLGILTGLESEAKIARQVPNAIVECSAATPQKSRWLARDLVKRGATRLMSFGIAGGLAPDLPLGALVIGTGVKAVDASWNGDAGWVRALSERLPMAHCGAVWGSEILVPTAKDKAQIYRKSQAMIVDMESQCVAQVAAEANVPFIVIRAVCDRADMDVPEIVMAAINTDGSINYGRAIGHALLRPAQIKDLLHVGQGTAKALKALRDAAKHLAA